MGHNVHCSNLDVGERTQAPIPKQVTRYPIEVIMVMIDLEESCVREPTKVIIALEEQLELVH
eukprot:scaffold55790_cov52-Cyclotella_meneghiniana.AAC.2